MHQKIAYLTLRDRRGFYIYDDLTFPPLAKRGWQVEEIPWDQPAVDWSQFAAVVIRSTWDYQKQVDAFLQVLSTISSSGTRLFNDLATIRWNVHKTYLFELLRAGVEIVPTIFRKQISWIEDLESLFSELRTEEVVIKPAVGANADDTYRLQRDELKSPSTPPVLGLFSDRELLAQPFLEKIVSEGEYSLFFFGNEFSHAVRKCPAPGDFRVQEEHGGTISSWRPGADMLAAGQRVLTALPAETLYARVDLVRLDSGSWGLIEVELIEPSLYFPFAPESVERFASALVASIEKGSRTRRG